MTRLANNEPSGASSGKFSNKVQFFCPSCSIFLDFVAAGPPLSNFVFILLAHDNHS